MASLQEIYQKFVNYSKPQLMGIAANEVVEITKLMVEKGAEKDTATYTILTAFANFSCLDGKIAGAEYEFFRDLFDYSPEELSYDDFFNLCKGENSAEVRNILRDLSSANTEFAVHLATLGSCICACDGTFSVAEQQYLEYICNLV